VAAPLRRLPDTETRSHIGGVVTISITAAALDAIAATLPESREAERRPDGKGGYLITLPHNVFNKLNLHPRARRVLFRRDPAHREGRLIFANLIA
jgi:hypothetical protein